MVLPVYPVYPRPVFNNDSSGIKKVERKGNVQDNPHRSKPDFSKGTKYKSGQESSQGGAFEKPRRYDSVEISEEGRKLLEQMKKEKQNNR